jgi:hypothetical protein
LYSKNIEMPSVSYIDLTLIPKGPKAQSRFFGCSGRLSRLQKHEWVSEILEEDRTM